MLKQAEPKQLSGFKLKVAYMAFKCGIHLNQPRLIKLSVDHGVLENARTDEEINNLLDGFNQKNNFEALELVLKNSSGSEWIAELLGQYLSDSLNSNEPKKFLKLFDIINQNNPKIFHVKEQSANPDLLTRCILIGRRTLFAGVMASRISGETYEKAYPNEEARKMLLSKIWETGDTAIFKVVHNKIKFQPRELEHAFTEAIKQPELDATKAKIVKNTAFACAIHLNQPNLIRITIAHGVLEKAQTNIELKDFLETLYLKRNFESLELVLQNATGNEAITKAFAKYLQSCLHHNHQENSRYLFDIIVQNDPRILLLKSLDIDPDLLTQCILNSKDTLSKGLMACSIPKEIYDEAYPDESARKALLTDILKAGNAKIFDALHSAIKFHPKELENALREAIGQTKLEAEVAGRFARELSKNQGGDQVLGEILAICIKQRRSELAKEILKHCPLVNSDELETLIRAAAHQGLTNIVEILARAASESPNLCSSAYRIFCAALKAGGENNLQPLIDGGLQLNGAEKNNVLGLFKLSKESVNILLQGEPDIESAIKNNNVEFVLQHVKRAKIANQNDKIDDWIKLAIKKGNAKIIEAFYTAGVCFENRSVEVTSHIIRFLCASEYSDFTERMINEAKEKMPGALEASPKSGVAPLHVAARYGNLKAVKALISMKVNVLAEHEEKTALHYAIIYGHIDVMAELFKHCSPSADEAKAFLELAFKTFNGNSNANITEFVARKLKAALSNPKDLDAVVESLRTLHSKVDLELQIRALLDGGLEFTEQQVASLLPFLKNEERKEIQNYKRPGYAVAMDVFDYGKTLQFLESNSGSEVDEFNPLGLQNPLCPPWLFRASKGQSTDSKEKHKDTWRLKVDPQTRPVHPVRQFLNSLPALTVLSKSAHFFYNWNSNIVAALLAMPSEEKQALNVMKNLLSREELGLCLVDENGVRVNCQQSEHEAMIEAQFVALAVNRNEYLHRIVDVTDETFTSGLSDSVSITRNKAAAKAQAKALIQANKEFRPYRIALRDQCDIVAITTALDAGTLEPNDALFQLDREIGALNRQIDHFSQVLNNEDLPDALVAWVGSEVVALQEARKKELEAARGRIIKQVSAS